ncbi:MAG: hypothetical protein ABI809_01200 [Caldimonas sp.]
MKADSRDDSDRPMAERGKQREGADVGGMRSNADGGLGDALQRSSERGDDAASATASTGSASSASPRPDLGHNAAPNGPLPTAHRTDERPDESAIESLGRAISEVVTGSEDDDPREASTRAP